jgi:EAL domain-containing protein (putative c-di-GMP-specific phosphodiesterase class I)
VLTEDDLAEDLAAAVRNRDLIAVYQPQISLATGSTVGVEALCRWNHPQLGPISPDVFIGIAERVGLIGGIGAFMLDESLASAAEWWASGRRLEVSVNVSPAQLSEEAFATGLQRALSGGRIPPTALTIEITESMPLFASHAVMRRLRSIRDAGIRISLDDYGAGHASTEALESLPLTEVKLDGGLIRDDAAHPLDELREIVDLARERELRVVAEGIETLSHLQRAVDARCDRAQGFLMGRPRPRAEVDWMTSY